MNLILPPATEAAQIVLDNDVDPSFWQMIQTWAVSAFWLTVKILLIVTSLMILQSILQEFKILDLISRIFAPLMTAMGLPRSTSFLWFVAQILGLTYGGAVMVEEVKNNKLSKHDNPC